MMSCQAVCASTIIEVFRTDVQEAGEAARLIDLLHRDFQGCRFSFDLDDCDRILKVTGTGFSPMQVTILLQAHGDQCELLAD